MRSIHIVLDEELLKAVDLAARRTQRNRAAMVRDALREHLRKLEMRSREEQDREGYARRPQEPAEARGWERRRHGRQNSTNRCTFLGSQHLTSGVCAMYRPLRD